MKWVAIALVVFAVVAGLCVLDVRCSSGKNDIPPVARIRGELEAGRHERRLQQADELAKLARDMRALARRYIERGEKRKARRAAGAAQELDRKIRELRGE